MSQELITKKKELVDFFLKNGFLLSNELLVKSDEDISEDKLKEILKRINSTDLIILNKDIIELVPEIYSASDINWIEMEESKAFSEKGKENAYSKFLEYLSEKKESKKEQYPVRILNKYIGETKKWDSGDFAEHLNIRFSALEKILRKRQELTNIVSINRIINKKEKESISLIGIVQNKDFTKNNNLVITLEDTTAQIKVVVNKNKPELFQEASKIVLDEVIGVIGVISNGVVFANNIIWPDVPINKELKKSKDECYALFLSDLHIGSKYFMYDEFMRFIKWLNMELGDENQMRIAEMVRYIFIVGDIVDGCGVYPNQEEDLLIKDCKAQYDECARLISMIPKHIKIIMCAGNHDAMRLAEPQLPVYKEFAEELYKLSNLIFVSNPALVNIHAKEDFPGFDVLLYHGYSFDYYVANVDFIRNNGGYERVDIIMKFLLQRRHLAPTHSSNSFVPDVRHDSLVIETVPDIFSTGHIHKALIGNYRGITLINSSCWQSITEYQKRHGHHPDPCRVPIVNLQTRTNRILRFSK